MSDISEMTLTYYVSRKEGWRGLATIEDSFDASIQRLEDNIEKRGGRLLTATRNDTDYTRISRTEITRKQKWEEKQRYERFKQLITEISHEKTWAGQKRVKLKESEKQDKHLVLAKELKQQWNIKVTVIPIGALGTVNKGLVKGLENLKITGQVETIILKREMPRVRKCSSCIERNETMNHIMS